MKNFNISCLDDFFLDGSMDIDNVLTAADRQIIIKHALDSVKANEYERHLPGMEHVQFYHGQSIIAACQEDGVIECVYALQNKEFLKKFGPSWYMAGFVKQPIEMIREYFGESLGIYFSFVGTATSMCFCFVILQSKLVLFVYFLEYYTVALVVPAILGIFQYFLSVSCVPYFCVFYVIWMTVTIRRQKKRRIS